MTFRQVLVFVIGIALSKSAAADCLAPLRIINASDQHSAYDNMPSFIHRIYDLREEHLRKCPEGKVILLINGDFSGLSKWAVDQGNLNYTLLSRLAPDFEIVVNVGNHEAFDWEGETGNRLFIQQSHMLSVSLERSQAKPFKLISANLETTTLGSRYIQPYRDIEYAEGKRIRFVGLALEDFFKKTDYGKQAEPKIFTGSLTPVVAAAEKELARAEADGIELVTFAFHDGLINVKNAMMEIEAIAKTKFPKVKLGPAFAAHDHRPGIEVAERVKVFDGGERYSFVRTDVTPTGEVVDHEFVAGQPNDTRRHALPRVNELLDIVHRELQRVAPMHRLVLASLPNPIFADRKDLQSRRHPLGNAISESLVDWGKVILSRHQISDVSVVAFFNSSSYRLEVDIPAGPFNAGMLWDIYPHQSKPRIGMVKGRHLKILFESIRKHREQESDPRRRYTPQLSNNLLEHSYMHLHYKNGHGPEFIPDQKRYALVLDGWLAKNGYGLEEWEQVFAEVEWLDSGVVPQQAVLRSYLPKHLVQLSANPCRYEIGTQAH